MPMICKREKNQINPFWISKKMREISGQMRKFIVNEKDISGE